MAWVVAAGLAPVAPAAATHLSLQLQDVQYDLAAGSSTWSYVVVGHGPPGLSHATLELGTCAQIVSCSPGPCGPVVNDKSTGVTGIKWDVGASFYQVTVDGLYAAEPVTFGIKAGREGYTGTTTGPSPTCNTLQCQEDSECDNGDVCDGAETCVDFQCQSGTPLDPDDGNACTEDACDPATGVSNTPIDPDDGNACTEDSCDPATGVSNTPIDPDDGNACTDDSCDPATGVSNTPIDPDDGNACTDDSCDPATGVSNTPIDPDDGNACTDDSCDPATGVSNDPIDPDDGNACTDDSCDPATGVSNDPIDPDDGNACTDDSCDPATGVSNDPIDPDDGVPCTDDACDPDAGVSNTPNDAACDDGDVCTTDVCDPAASTRADGCVVTCDPSNDESECFVEVGDRVWNDLDRDGLQDDGEPGIGGVRLDVRYCGDGSVGMPVTAPDGSYSARLATCNSDESFEVRVKGSNFDLNGALFGGVETEAFVGPDALDSNCRGGVTDCRVIGRGESDGDVDCGYYFGEVQLTPTGTECSNFVFGSPLPAQDQDALGYTLRKGKIGSVTPGAYILWTELPLEAGSNNVMVLQSAAPDFALVDVGNDGAKVWDDLCGRLATVTTVGSNGFVELIVDAPMAGTYYLSVKYNSSSLSGAPNPGGSVVFTYVTVINGVPFTADSLVLDRRK